MAPATAGTVWSGIERTWDEQVRGDSAIQGHHFSVPTAGPLLRRPLGFAHVTSLPNVSVMGNWGILKEWMRNPPLPQDRVVWDGGCGGSSVPLNVIGLPFLRTLGSSVPVGVWKDLWPAAACGQGSEEAMPGPMCPTSVQEKGTAGWSGPYLMQGLQML